jgi:hypothetical protein
MASKAYVGKIVLYVHPKLSAHPPAIVTRVLPDGTVNATVFTDSGRTFPVYNLPVGDAAWSVTGAPHWINTEGDQDG